MRDKQSAASARPKAKLRRAGVILGAGLGLSMMAVPAFAAEGSSGTSADSSLRAKHVEIEKCLKDAGIKLPPRHVRGRLDRPRNPQRVEDRRDEVKTALEKCGIKVPTREEMEARRAEMRSCLESQGIDVPDRPIDRPGPRGPHFEPRDRGEKSSEVREAMQVCRDKLAPPSA